MKIQSGARVSAGFKAMYADGVLTYFNRRERYPAARSADPGVLDALARVISVGVKAGQAAEGRQAPLPRRSGS